MQKLIKSHSKSAPNLTEPIKINQIALGLFEDNYYRVRIIRKLG